MKKKEQEIPEALPINYDLKGSPTEGMQRLLQLSLKAMEQGGSQNISIMDRARAYRVKKLPFGIFQLDWLTHGGAPLNRMTRLSGKYTAGKTTLMLKLLANSQKWCRYCQSPIVVSPDTGDKDCACPKPRFCLGSKQLASYISQEEANCLADGKIPPTAQKDSAGYYLTAAARKGRADIVEMYRCAPMQALFIETEHKLDLEWAKQNGVDTNLVLVLGSDWAEKTINLTESALYSGEVDLVCIDTLTYLTGKDSIEKTADQAKKIASRATLIKCLFEKITSAQFAGGVCSETSITVISNSQVRMVGIGGYAPHLGTADGSVADHLFAMDISLQPKGYEWLNREYASFANYGFTVTRNQTGGSSGVSGEFKLWVDPSPNSPYKVGDTDDFKQTIEFGRKTELIDDAPPYTFSTPYVNGGKVSCGKLKDLEKFLQENPTIFLDLRQRVLNKVISIRTEAKEEKK